MEIPTCHDKYLRVMINTYELESVEQVRKRLSEYSGQYHIVVDINHRYYSFDIIKLASA